MTKHLSCQISHQKESLIKKQEEELKEKETYEREYSKRKNLYQKMRGTYQTELAKLDKSPDDVKSLLKEKRSVSRGGSVSRGASVDGSAGKKTTFRR